MASRWHEPQDLVPQKSRGTEAMSVEREISAQALCHELFREVEGSLSDVWISDEPSTDDPAEYLRFVNGNLLALEEVRGIIKKFLKRHRRQAEKRDTSL
jgi:hypothetical protein